MNSPFPGMDPFIEGFGLWEDFHHNLITEIQGAISAALPERYVVRAGERSFALVETEYREGFLEIRELNPERKLITCIETLSPSNKRLGTPGWELYKRKRQAYLEGAANFVEIDLLRGGRRMPMEDDRPESPYYLLVSRKTQAPRCSVWAAHYLRFLPPIPIPLAPPDQDIVLSLQPLIGAVYSRSHYERDIDYRRQLNPPLYPDEVAWLTERLRQQS
jgi:Protein of unknown function (DUF4058)